MAVCRYKDCDQPVYIDRKCYRHFKTTNRINPRSRKATK